MLECGCPEKIPPWDGTDIDLGGRCVHRLSIPTLFHMPLAYELYVKRQQQQINQLALEESWPGLVFTRVGLLRGSIMRLLEGASPAHHVGFLPSPFQLRAKLHHGNVSTARRSISEIQMDLLNAGRLPKELYLCHVTCPHCSERRGGDQILVLRRWVDSPRLTRRIRTRSEKN